MDFFQASELCSQRGAALSPYTTEAQQVFVDLLCDESLGMKCWIGSAESSNSCQYISKSEVSTSKCNEQMSVVCRREL
jgi:hypothetical protein